MNTTTTRSKDVTADTLRSKARQLYSAADFLEQYRGNSTLANNLRDEAAHLQRTAGQIDAYMTRRG
jgi:hypothetical protein